MEAAGFGPDVVFVHGLPGLARDFRPLTSRLADRFHCVAYDRAGYGTSAPNIRVEEAGLSQNVEQLLALLDSLGLGRIALVGWSYGGPIVLAAAARAPERVSEVVLFSAPSSDFRWPGKLSDRVLQTPVGGLVLRVMRALGPRALRRPLDEAYGRHAPAAVLEDFVGNLSGPGVIDQMLAEGRGLDLSTVPVADVEQRCLLIHGEADANVPASEGGRLAASLSHAELRVIPEAGHWPFATHSEEVADHMCRFLSGPSEATGSDPTG